ncbi:MAG: MFS transporter [Actinomycetota bacterium]
MAASGGHAEGPTGAAPDGTPDRPTDPFPHVTIGLLGVVTIAAYGTWYYAFGVLLDPILADTGWSEGWVAGTYALATTVGALLALPAGRIVDRVGGRPVFAIAAALAVGGLVTASYARALPVFVAGALTGAAALQAFCFYHVTQTTAVRAAPDRPNSAIAVLTIYGAFASMIYLPLAALLVETTGWRTTLRILVLGTAVVLLAAAVGVRRARLHRR